jgi:hypothetical protein
MRLGRKKQERTKQRRMAAEGLARLFVAIHGAEASTDRGGLNRRQFAS